MGSAYVDKSLTKVIEEPTKRRALLDLTLRNKERLVGDVKVWGSLGCSGHEKVKFRISRGNNKAKSRITALDFRRPEFSPFRDLLEKVP